MLFFQPTVKAVEWIDSNFEHFSLKDGLSSNTIYCLHRDHNGFLWVGTNNGLNRYDGYKFVAYRNQLADNNSISNDHISDIYEDDKGLIWIATWKFLNSFNSKNGQFKIYKYKTNPTAELDCRVNVIEYWNSDTLIIGTNIGPALFCKSSGKYIFFNLNKNSNNTNAKYVFGLKKIAAKKILVATYDDVYTLNPYDKKVEKISTNKLRMHKNYSHVTGKITNYNKHEWLIQTWNADILIFNEQLNTLNNHFFEKAYNDKDYGCGTLATLKEDNTYLFGTNGNGLFVADLNLKIKQKISYNNNNPQGISSNYITSILHDKDGIYWIGTDKGLNKFDPSNQKLKSFNYKFNSPFFSNDDKLISLLITHHNNNYFQGLWGAYTIDKSNNEVKFLNELNTKNFKNVFGYLRYVKDSTLCLYREGGFQTFYEDGKQSFLKPIQIKDFYINKEYGYPSDVKYYKGKYYALFDNIGLYCIDPINGNFERIKLSLENNKEIVAERFNTLEIDLKNIDAFYLGTSPRGLYKINCITGKASKIEIPIIPKNDVLNISKIRIDNKGNMWLATEFHGVLYYNKLKNKWSELTAHNEIGNNHIRNIELFGDSILGVMVHDLAFFLHIKNNQLIKISQNQGLSEIAIPASVFIKNEEIFFAQQNGFLKGTFKKLLSNEQSNGVVFTEIFSNNKSTLLFANKSSINLAYPENSLRISFASLSFHHPAQNKFQYQFEGQNKWTNSSNDHELVLHKLPYGQYKLFIREVNSPKKIATLEIYVQAPFYLRPWFFILIIISFFVLALFIYRVLLLRKIAILNTRDTIARDLHDEVGSALTSISYLSEVGKLQSANENPIFEKIGDTSRNITALMNDIIWALNPDKDNALSLVQRINYFIQENRHFQSIDIKFDYSHKLLKHEFNMQQRKSLYLIFKEGLNNAFKYANASKINIRLVKNTNVIMLEMEDNGKGFLKGNTQGNGLKNMQKRAKDIKANFEIISSPNNGTIIRVILNHHNW